MNYRVVGTNCMCHPETCCHWNYYIFDSNNLKLVGSDNYNDLQKICDKLNKGTH